MKTIIYFIIFSTLSISVLSQSARTSICLSASDETKSQMLDLTSFKSVSFDPESAPAWNIAKNASKVNLMNHADAVALIGSEIYSSIDFEGSVRVDTNWDNDFIGFVFAYNNEKSFYVVTWKKTSETWLGNKAERGIQLKLVNSPAGPSDALSKSLWRTKDTENEVKLLWKADVAWQSFTSYKFNILHRPKIGLIRITVFNGTNEVVDSKNIFDNELKEGSVGVYDHSQINTTWFGLNVQCNEKVPQNVYDDLEPHSRYGIQVDYKCSYKKDEVPPLFAKFDVIKLNPDAAYEVQEDNIEQITNANAELIISPNIYSVVDFKGTFRVTSDEDEGYLGFVFAYKSEKSFYAFMWKKATGGDNEILANLKLVNSRTGRSKELSDALWNTADTPNQVKLLWKDEKSVGWSPYKNYTYHILHRPSIELIRITIHEGEKLIVDTGNIIDSTLKEGHSGTLTHSQRNVEWFGISLKCNEKIPETFYKDLPAELQVDVQVEYDCDNDVNTGGCDTNMDRDRDGVPDIQDNCPEVPNADQLDTDDDSIGDLCDPDIDNDGIENYNDNCPLGYNPDQKDTDKNGVGDLCENDFDLDTVPNNVDNCPNNSKISKTDFRTFDMVALDPVGEAQKDPNWVILDEGTKILQTLNSDPGLAVGKATFGGVDFEGIFRIEDEQDDDYAGFVFSYQNDHKFYTVMWKKHYQDYWKPKPFVARGEEGIQLKLVNSATGPGETLRNSLWHTGDTKDQVKLLWKYPNNIGWRPHHNYKWMLMHRPEIGLIRFKLFQNDKELVDSGNIFDTTLRGGRIGVLCFSQEKITWSDISYRCNDKISKSIYNEIPEKFHSKVIIDHEN